jgi:ankyrin repeat protein
MNVDLFKSFPSWTNYVYTSLVVVFLVGFGYATIRSRRRLRKFLHFSRGLVIMSFYGIFRIFFWLYFKRDPSSVPGRDISKLSNDPEKDAAYTKSENATVLKWAACSGRTDVVRQILSSSSTKIAGSSLNPGTSGQALVMATQNGHVEAATLLIENGEGLLYADDKGATALHHASRSGLDTVVKLLLQKGAKQEARDHNGKTALDYAMESNHEPTIDLLLKRGKNANKQGTADLRSLHFSARTGDLESLKELHKNGSSFDSRDGKGQTVLFHAVKGKQHETMKWLLENGANLEAVDKEGLTALHHAAVDYDVKSAEILLEKGANVDALSVKNLTPLLCIPNSNGISVLKLLHAGGANINAMDKYLNGITHKASSQGDAGMPLLQVLRDLGADLHRSGSGANTPAHLAAEAGSVRMLQLLSNAGCDLLRPQNIDGYTPLMSAAHGGEANTMRFLLDKGASYDVVDANGTSLIELTIQWGNPTVMQTLQDAGVNYNSSSPPSRGISIAHPVWAAIHSGLDAPVRKILDDGLSPEYRYDGISLLHLALEVSNLRVSRLLLDRGASASLPDSKGWTPLHSAAFSGEVEATLLILQHMNLVREAGTDWLPKDHQDWTPLDLAKFYRHDDVVRVLDPQGIVETFAWMKPRVGSQADGLKVSSRPVVGESAVPGVAEAPSPTR